MERTERQKVSPDITQVYVELSTHCNLACRTCVRHSIENFRPCHFTRPLMRRLLPMLKGLPSLRRIVLLGFGEALCNPDFTRHLSALRQCGADIVLVSNAHFIDGKTADFIVKLPVDELWLSWDDDPTQAPRNRRGAAASSFQDRIALVLAAREAANARKPLLGMEIVAMRSNANSIPSIVRFGRDAGAERFIISNIFPYSETMKEEILYTVFGTPDVSLEKLLKTEARKADIIIAGQSADVPRRCAFIERGTVFVTAEGDIAPCPELAHTHPAWYFGSRRTHRRFIAGNIARGTIDSAWHTREFTELRNMFEYYEFPDCATCREPDMCWHRTVEMKDCYRNTTPCGECLWAKGIVLCP
ncbi:MAG: SPASM domain-containing protein [Spirochaetes bacterium]|nr:SPASM domain-containing protein [Spirochaetota bacterium]